MDFRTRLNTRNINSTKITRKTTIQRTKTAMSTAVPPSTETQLSSVMECGTPVPRDGFLAPTACHIDPSLSVYMD